MITEFLLGLFDPVIGWVAAGLGALPDLDGISWVARGAGTLDQIVPLGLVLTYIGTWAGFLVTAIATRGTRMVVSYVPTIGGVS